METKIWPLYFLSTGTPVHSAQQKVFKLNKAAVKDHLGDGILIQDATALMQEIKINTDHTDLMDWSHTFINHNNWTHQISQQRNAERVWKDFNPLESKVILINYFYKFN